MRKLILIAALALVSCTKEVITPATPATNKENHPNCFAKTAIELAVEKAGKPSHSMCGVKIEGDLILVDLPTANIKWSFAAFEWVMKFCKENPQCYPVHKNENNNTDYLYIQWNNY